MKTIQKASGAAVSKRAVPGGKPFTAGDDPRRHKLGRMSLDRAAFSARLNNGLCNGEGDPEELAALLWREARRGKPWAIVELLNRIMGREPIGVSLSGEPVIYRIVYDDTPDDVGRVPAITERTPQTDGEKK